MRTKKAAQPKPTRWTICHGALFNEDTEDSDFPSDQESSSSGISDLELITSGDYDVLAEGRAEKEKKIAQQAKSREAMRARADKEALAAKERQDCAAKEREAHAAEEQEARATEEEARATEEEARAAEEEEARSPEENEELERYICSLHVHFPSTDFTIYKARNFANRRTSHHAA